MRKGIIHIGANKGQESDRYYESGDPKVIFIEANPFVIPDLVSRIEKYKNQKAIQALVTDRDGVECDFFCDKNNSGQSSSLFDFHLHKKMFPKVVMGDSIRLVGKTLPTILRENEILLEEFNEINMDVEGAELLVLKGAEGILSNFERIILEATDFEARKGQPLLRDIEAFMLGHNFVNTSQRKIHPADGVNVVDIDEGCYYEVVYSRRNTTQYTVGELNGLLESGLSLEQIFEEERKNPLPGRTW